MNDKLKLLILVLQTIEADDTIPVEIDQPLVIAATFLANQCLIDEDGHPDRKNIDMVASSGFLIIPGEIDRFGWVTGLIHLSRGAIQFG